MTFKMKGFSGFKQKDPEPKQPSEMQKLKEASEVSESKEATASTEEIASTEKESNDGFEGPLGFQDYVAGKVLGLTSKGKATEALNK